MLWEAQYRKLVSGEWNGPVASALRGLLAVLEIPYGWVVQRRNARFERGAIQPIRVSAPVISVGNLTVGGTGKTPFVAWLARWFLERNVQVTVISRGYGAGSGKPNDEALELALRLPGVPHLQNPDRTAAAQAAIGANPRQVLILDDAFQHRRLARDRDIVLLDAFAPFGYGHLLPRGLLREPISSLARADVVALSRSDAIEESARREIEAIVRQHAPRAIWVELAHRPRQLISTAGNATSISSLAGQRVAAFCGIGNPAGFRHTLASCGCDVAGWLELPDHCAYGPSELARLTRWLESVDVQHVVCTCKDLVKIPREELAGKKLWALEIEMEIGRGGEALDVALDDIIAEVASSPSRSSA